MLIKVISKEKDKYIVRALCNMQSIIIDKENLLQYIKEGRVINAKASKNGRITFKDRQYSYVYWLEMLDDLDMRCVESKYSLDRADIVIHELVPGKDVQLVLSGDTMQQVAEWHVIDTNTGIKMKGSIITAPDSLVDRLTEECKDLDKYMNKSDDMKKI